MGGRQWSVRKRYSQFYQFRMVSLAHNDHFIVDDGK